MDGWGQDLQVSRRDYKQGHRRAHGALAIRRADIQQEEVVIVIQEGSRSRERRARVSIRRLEVG